MIARRRTAVRASADDNVRDAGGVRAVARAARILTVLADHPYPLGVVELADLVDLSPASAHRILNTLVQIGWVGQNSRTSKYRLGMRAMGVGAVGLASNPVASEGKLFLERLAKWSGSDASLSTLTGVKTVEFARVDGGDPDAIRPGRGDPQPAHATAGGKLLLSYLPAEELRYLYDIEGLTRYTPNTITDPAQMTEELASIRERGFAIDDCERFESLRAIAVPVLDSEELPIAAMSCTGRLDPARDAEIVSTLLSLARELSHALRATGDLPAAPL